MPRVLYNGIWQVDGFSAEGYRLDPFLTDELRWCRVVFDRPFLMSDLVMVTVHHMDDSFEVFGGRIDPAKHFIDLTNRVELGTYEETPTNIRLTRQNSHPANGAMLASDPAGAGWQDRACSSVSAFHDEGRP